MQGFLFATPALSAPHEDTYDPQSCKTDAHGKLYIGLGRNVLAFPAHHDVVVENPLHPGNNPIPPPDPSQLEGCLENPRQLDGYAILYAGFAALNGEQPTSRGQSFGTLVFELIRTLRGDAVPTDNDPPWPSEDEQALLPPLICPKATITEELPNGLTACRVKPHLPNEDVKDQRDWGGTYVARSDVYTTPMNRQFIIFCDQLVFRSAVPRCSVAYIVTPGLGLTYRFQPYVGPNIVPLDRIIDFDKELRAAITAMTVKDYPWRTK
jgi:hypothetical protein